jgi:hypothetical protein
LPTYSPYLQNNMQIEKTIMQRLNQNRSISMTFLLPAGSWLNGAVMPSSSTTMARSVRKLELILTLCDEVQPRRCDFEGCPGRWTRPGTGLQCARQGKHRPGTGMQRRAGGAVPGAKSRLNREGVQGAADGLVLQAGHAAGILAESVEKPTDNGSASLFCCHVADADSPETISPLAPAHFPLPTPCAWARGYFDGNTRSRC